MASGAKPGERRGGRAKGTPNKMTFMKTQMAMKAMAETDSSQQLKATDMLNRVMAEAYAMSREYGPQSNKYDDDLYKSYLKLTVYTAGKLAPYQSPQLSTVKVGGDRDNPLMIREGVTSKQVMEELKQKILETGLLPSKMVDVTPNKTETDGVDGQAR
jgi:catalase (peroxidase I)